jgi:dihydroneopterin aldolase
MKGWLIIELKQLRFYAFHGLYPEEKKTGNEFEVNLAVFHQPKNKVVTDINETVNYADLYDLVKQKMKEPVELIETLCMTIAHSIQEKFPSVKKVDISICKLTPPIAGFAGRVETRFILDDN